MPVKDIFDLFQERDIQKVLLGITEKITIPYEARKLGLYLGCRADNVEYHLQKYDFREAAYKFLYWAENNYGEVKMWENIIEALTSLEKNRAIMELGLRERLAAAQQRNSVIIYNSLIMRISLENYPTEE